MTSSHQWIFASRESDPAAIRSRLEGHPVADAVSIVPFIQTATGYGIVIIRELRPIIGGYVYSFPGGLIDKGESPEETAVRELREETGLNVVRFISKSPFIFSSAGMTNECLNMLFCIAEGEVTSKGAEENEDIEVLILDFDSLGPLCREGLHGARSWPVLFLISLMGKYLSSTEIVEMIAVGKVGLGM